MLLTPAAPRCRHHISANGGQPQLLKSELTARRHSSFSSSSSSSLSSNNNAKVKNRTFKKKQQKRRRFSIKALVSVDVGPAAVLGTSLMLSSIALYQIRATRPEVSRDKDVFFSSVGLLCGGILVFQGWRLDPLMLFGQLMTAGTAIAFASETISPKPGGQSLHRPKSLFVRVDARGSFIGSNGGSSDGTRHHHQYEYREHAFVGYTEKTKKTKKKCTDVSQMCVSWAQAGECEKNREYMFENCCCGAS